MDFYSPFMARFLPEVIVFGNFGYPSGEVMEVKISVQPKLNDIPVQPKPFFCPNCRSNRVKFNLLITYSQSFMKNAWDGSVSDTAEPVLVPTDEPQIQCRVCGFTGNEMRFIKQAEREPRY